MKFAPRILVLASALVVSAHAQFFTILTGNIDLGPTPVGAVVKREVAVTTLGSVPPANFLIVGQAEGPFNVIKVSPVGTFTEKPGKLTLNVEIVMTLPGEKAGKLLIAGLCGNAVCNKTGTITLTGTGTAAGAKTYADNTNTVLADGPVSLATGEEVEEAVDFNLGGPLPLTFRRYYGSYLQVNAVSSALGTNWMHNFDVSMSLFANAASVTLFRGKTVTFSTGNGNVFTLSSTERYPYQLVSLSNGTAFLDPESNLIYSFDPTGALIQIADRDGNTLTVTQAPGGVGPASVTDGVRTLTFTYSGSNLTQVADQAGNVVTYEYANGSLAAWTNQDGRRSTLAYTTSGVLSALLTALTEPLSNQRFSQLYDTQGRVRSQADSHGNAGTIAYSTTTNGARLTDPLGNTYAAAHDASGDVTSVSDSTLATSRFRYDSNFHPVNVFDRAGFLTSFTWDASSGRLVSSTDAGGNITGFSFATSNSGGLTFSDLSAATFADKTTLALTRDSHANVTAVTDESGAAWEADRNKQNLIGTLTNPSGGVTAFAYGNGKTLASIQANSGDTTSISYNSALRPNLITNADQSTVNFIYDGAGNLIGVKDELSNSAAAAFDANNNLTGFTDTLGGVTSFSYNADDNLSASADALGNSTQIAYDSAQRVQSITNSAGNSITYAYDAANRAVSATDAAGKSTKFAWDTEARLIGVTDALKRVTSLTRDSIGHIVAVTTPNNERWTFTYDPLGRLSASVGPAGGKVQYTYDPRGLLSGIVLPGNVAGSFDINELGLITKITDPNGSVWSAALDKMGRQSSFSDPVGNTATFQYDSRQRLSKMGLPLGAVQFGYDAASNLTSIQLPGGASLTYTYDPNGRLTSANGLTLAYDKAGRIISSNGLAIGHDDAGRMGSITYASGKTVQYTYDTRGLLASVADWTGGTTNFDYDAAGELTSITYPNGVREDDTYDKNGRLAGRMLSHGGAEIGSFTLTRGSSGAILSSDRPSVFTPGMPAGATMLAYDAASQLKSATYDALGRVTSDALRKYQWDAADRLNAYTGADGTANFTYDGLGQRISRVSGASAQTYVIDYATESPSLAVVRSGTADERYYVWLPNGRLLYRIDAANGAHSFYHFDESGTTLALTGDSGSVTDTYAVSPFGESVTHMGPSDNPFVYQGAYGAFQEGATGLYYARGRYYDSSTQRFLSRAAGNSYDPHALNPYQFEFESPIEGGQTAPGANPDIFAFSFAASRLPTAHEALSTPPSLVTPPASGGCPKLTPEQDLYRSVVLGPSSTVNNARVSGLPVAHKPYSIIDTRSLLPFENCAAPDSFSDYLARRQGMGLDSAPNSATNVPDGITTAQDIAASIIQSIERRSPAHEISPAQGFLKQARRLHQLGNPGGCPAASSCADDPSTRGQWAAIVNRFFIY